MQTSEVNIPLLRKAVEFATAESMKPPELCEWQQSEYVVPRNASERREWGMIASSHNTRDFGRAQGCGTCFCIAGFIVNSTLGPTPNIHSAAAELLGITEAQASDLFAGGNDIVDVQRIASEIAAEVGERL